MTEVILTDILIKFAVGLLVAVQLVKFKKQNDQQTAVLT